MNTNVNIYLLKPGPCAAVVLLWLLLGMGLPGAAIASTPSVASWANQDSTWLYTVEVPVQGQSAADRQQAAGQGLLQVLTRLTGLTSVPRNAVVAQAVAQPTRLYSAFDFIDDDSGPSGESKVRVVFQRQSILSLIEQANLPVWWEQRPNLLVWLVVQEGGQRRILSGADQHPLITSLQQRASDRGVRLQFPIMDLRDSLEITPADVWGRVSASIRRASDRYAPGLIAVGRFDTKVNIGIRQYSGQWEIWTEDASPRVVDLRAVDADQAGIDGVDEVVQSLVEQYAVLPRGQRQTRVLVNNVGDMGAYADLIGYLQGLTFLQQVQVLKVQGDALWLDVYGQAEATQLAFLLTSQKRLRVRETSLRQGTNNFGGAAITLDWLG